MVESHHFPQGLNMLLAHTLLLGKTGPRSIESIIMKILMGYLHGREDKRDIEQPPSFGERIKKTCMRSWADSLAGLHTLIRPARDIEDYLNRTGDVL